MRQEYPQLGHGPNPIWQVLGAIVSLGIFALLFVLGLAVVAIVAGLVAVGLVGWWIRSWWYRRRLGAAPSEAAGSEDYIVAEYTVIEREPETRDRG